MPIYEYQAQDPQHGCPRCRKGFELLRRISDPPLERCPQCRNPVRQLISAPAIGRSASNLDSRAKAAGFHKLEKRDKGVYEKKY